MIIHRDYRSASDSIVKVFDDRIEFYNPGRLPDSISVKDLLANNYKSTPRNKLIADFCKSIGLIEKYGSGIRRVIEHFDEANLPRPEFRNISEGFMVTVFASNILAKTDKKSIKNKEKSKEKIVKIITENPHVTTNELSGLTGLSIGGVEKNIRVLKDHGILKRVGPAKGGYWKITGK